MFRQNYVSAVLVALLVIVGTARAIRAPINVTVNKCCRFGEQMNDDRQCLGGGSDKWFPLVYLVQKDKYFVPEGEIPRFIRISEQTLPTTCERPELFTSSFAILSNGTLFLSELHKLISTENYCAEQKKVLLCGLQSDAPAPPQRIAQGANPLTAIDSAAATTTLVKRPIRLRKCCGQTAVYDRQRATCGNLAHGHPTLSKVVINRTVDFAYGFPKCQQNDAVYTMVGAFNGGQYNADTGSVRSEGGREFGADEYCLEHTVEELASNDSDVSVFTCAEHFSNPEQVPVNHYVSVLFFF